MKRRFALKTLTAAVAMAGAVNLSYAQSTIKVGVLHSLSGTMAIQRPS